MGSGKPMTCNSDERLKLIDNHPFTIPHCDMVLRQKPTINKQLDVMTITVDRKRQAETLH
jgi:hypothetical protein